jgi:hypothetical protein
MTETSFIATLRAFKNDKNPRWAGYMVLAEEINEAQKTFGEERTTEIMKQEFGE